MIIPKWLDMFNKSFPLFELSLDHLYGGHIAEGRNHISSLNPIRTTATRLENSTSGMRTFEKNGSLQIQKGKAPNTEERSGSIVGAQSTDWDTEEADALEDVSPHMVDSDVAGRTSAEHVSHSVRSRSRRPVENAWENGSPDHMVDSDAAARTSPEHVSHSERSRSRRPIENGNSSSSTIPPTHGAKKAKASIAESMAGYIDFMKNRQKPTNPPEEFSVSKCINAMEKMDNITDD